MIKLKIANLKEKIGKNLSEIARETGLNRNTINGIFLEKVDGIKFETLNQLCATYNIAVGDVLEFVSDEKEGADHGLIYKQEGELVPVTAWHPTVAANKLDSKFFSLGYGELEVFFKNDYGQMYWRKEQATKLAKWSYLRYGNKDKFQQLYEAYSKSADEIRYLYYDMDLEKALKLNKKEVASISLRLERAYEKFWGLSMFIDAFDPGYDQQKIKQIAEKLGLNHEEVSALTTPVELTYNNERRLRLLAIVDKIRSKSLDKKGLEKYLQSSHEVSKYIKDFDFYKSNYSTVDHISEQEAKEEITQLLGDKKALKSEYNELRDYSERRLAKIRAILKKHKLKNNPLDFFAKTTYWREHRKMINLMGIHVIDLILSKIERETGISKKYLKYLSHKELSLAVNGLISRETLKRRREDGMILIVREDGYKVLEGKEANSVRDELEERLSRGVSQDTVAGQVASQGYAKGVARIILDLRDFDRFKEGEILITGMTRPEFVPLMKKAAGIVTNEGGVTCHAAIVSRELNKPCIIGTQNATKLINDGDMVEVRANHGTVRILKRAE